MYTEGNRVSSNAAVTFYPRPALKRLVAFYLFLSLAIILLFCGGPVKHRLGMVISLGLLALMGVSISKVIVTYADYVSIRTDSLLIIYRNREMVIPFDSIEKIQKYPLPEPQLPTTVRWTVRFKKRIISRVLFLTEENASCLIDTVNAYFGRIVFRHY